MTTTEESGNDKVDAQFRAKVESRKVILRADRLAREELADEESRLADEAWVPPVAYTGTTFLDTPDPDLRCRVDDVWPLGGNVLLVAQAKVGKTTLVLNLVYALVTGRKFLGRFDPVPVEGKVAILDLELPEPMLREWMRDLGLGSDQVLAVPLRGRGGWLAGCLIDAAARSRFANWLAENQVEILIIDPLGSLFAGAGIDENSNSEVGKLLRGGLAALQAESGVKEILLVHHAGHDMERARGASTLLDWPDAIWTYTAKARSGPGDYDNFADPDEPRFLKVEGRVEGLPKTRVNYDRETRRLVIDKDPGQFVAERRLQRDEALDQHVEHTLIEHFHGRAPSLNAWEKVAKGNAAQFRASVARLVANGTVVERPGLLKNSKSFVHRDCDVLEGGVAEPDGSEDDGRGDEAGHDQEADTRPPRLEVVRNEEDEPRTTPSPRPVL